MRFECQPQCYWIPQMSMPKLVPTCQTHRWESVSLHKHPSVPSFYLLIWTKYCIKSKWIEHQTIFYYFKPFKNEYCVNYWKIYLQVRWTLSHFGPMAVNLLTRALDWMSFRNVCELGFFIPFIPFIASFASAIVLSSSSRSKSIR